MLTWNLCRPGLPQFTEAIHGISEKLTHCDFAFFQELAFPSTDSDLQSLEHAFAQAASPNLLLLNPDNPHDTAIMVHHTWRQSYRRQFSNRWGILALFEPKPGTWISLCSFHMPHHGQQDHEEIYDAATTEVTELLATHSKGHIMFAADWNTEPSSPKGTELRTFLEHHHTTVASPTAWTWHSRRPTATSEGNREATSATTTGRESMQTDCQQTQHATRIYDYFHLPSHMHGHSNTYVHLSLDTHRISDHRPVVTHVDGGPEHSRTFSTPRPLAGWKPHSQRDLKQFRDDFILCWSKLIGSSSDMATVTCAQIQSVFATVATQLRQCRSTVLYALPDIEEQGMAADRDSLVAAMALLPRWSQEWTRACRQLAVVRLKLRRHRQRLHLDQLPRQPKASRPPPTSLQRSADDEPEQDRTKWPQLVSDHIAEKFARPGHTEAEAERSTARWLQQWEEKAANSEHTHDELTWNEYLQGLDSLRLAAATGKDKVPATVLAYIPGDVHKQLHKAMANRLAGRHTDPLPQWSTFHMYLLPKKGDTSLLTRWRGIALAPALYKLYEILLWQQIDKHLPPLPPPVLGFRAGCQPQDIISPLTDALRKAYEWKKPLAVISLDIRSAFDEVGHEQLAAELHGHDTPPQLVAALARELAHLTIIPQFMDTDCPPVRQFRGVRQGGPRSPRAFNALIQSSLHDLHTEWANPEAEPFVDWTEEHHMQAQCWFIWADNIFMLGSTPRVLHTRARDIERRLRRLGLHFSPDSLEYIANEHFDNTYHMSLEAGPFAQRETLPVLGVHLDDRASTDTMYHHRLRSATTLWTKLRAVLCSSSTPHKTRARAFYNTVGASLLYGSNLWTPSTELQNHLNAAEARWLRQLKGDRREIQETIVDYLRRTKKQHGQFRQAHHIPGFWERQVESIHKWHGHMARAPAHRRAAADWHDWRSPHWYTTMQALGGGQVPRPWARRRRGPATHTPAAAMHTWRSDWQGLTSDRTVWRDSMASWKKFAQEKWPGRLLHRAPPSTANRKRANFTTMRAQAYRLHHTDPATTPPSKKPRLFQGHHPDRSETPPPKRQRHDNIQTLPPIPFQSDTTLPVCHTVASLRNRGEIEFQPPVQHIPIHTSTSSSSHLPWNP